ncbi:MAG: TrmH family RNA methyltransferase [Nitriliruptoraceae bacterium]
MPAAYGASVGLVTAARADPTLVVLEGVHAVKHAVRFGAHVDAVVSPDLSAARDLLASLAPDVSLPPDSVEVDPATWRRLLGGRDLPSPLLAVARRPVWSLHQLDGGRVVVLEDPRHLGNLGATIRVAAAADAAGVVVVGAADPWHPSCVRAAAGLHFALPVLRVADVRGLDGLDLPIVAIDPDGDELSATTLPADGLLAFGTERAGLSPELRARATRALRIPMRAGVSSLNLATAVAITLYTARPGDPGHTDRPAGSGQADTTKGRCTS